MFPLKTRDRLFDTVYKKIYSSARHGGAAAGGMFWQLLAKGVEHYSDGIVLSEMPSTASVIAKQSRKLTHLRERYARRKKKKGQEPRGGIYTTMT